MARTWGRGNGGERSAARPMPRWWKQLFHFGLGRDGLERWEWFVDQRHTRLVVERPWPRMAVVGEQCDSRNENNREKDSSIRTCTSARAPIKSLVL